MLYEVITYPPFGAKKPGHAGDCGIFTLETPTRCPTAPMDGHLPADWCVPDSFMLSPPRFYDAQLVPFATGSRSRPYFTTAV